MSPDFTPLIALYNARRYVELENKVRALLAHQPGVPFAWQLLGGALQMQGKDALNAFWQVTVLSPNDPVAHFNLGVAYKGAGQLQHAANSYRKALSLKPDYVEALGNLGRVLLVLEQSEAAAECYRHLVRLKPKDAEAHCNLGVVFQKLGNATAALQYLERAVQINPAFAQAYANLGNLLRELGHTQQALQAYQKAAALKPDAAEIFSSLGLVLYELKRYEEALACCQQAIALNSKLADAHNNFGLCLKAMGQLERAAASYRQAIVCNPDSASAHSNLGNVQRELSLYEEAIASYRRAIALRPGMAEAHNNLGLAQSDFGRYADASISFKRALELKPDYFDAHSNLLMAACYTSQDAQAYLSEARRYGASVAGKIAARYDTWGCNLEPQRLRVGIVSGDLCRHSVGYFIASLLEYLDTSCIELYAYSNNPASDDLTIQLRRHCAAWHSVYALNDQDAAHLIQSHGIHVLLDISGHTAKNRLPVLAWKPAPVQCTWLGLPTTTGVAEMDYVLGDPIATPTEDAGHFAEQIWQLPETYLCLSIPDEAPPASALPVLASGYVTLGSFNNLAKVNDATVAAWSRILNALPQARLLLKAKQLKDPAIVAATQMRFAVHGIQKERLSLEATTKQRCDHLATYHRVDMALDTFPYPGVTTSAEALWMGVPVLSMQGDRFLSRTAASIAHTIGLSDWVAQSEDDYVAKAVAFAGDMPKLAALRAGLREQARRSPLFDAPRFAQHFEQSLWGMWQSKQERIKGGA
jgi:predicted O-linked N-acetylglucosamine transferase (SPINDLY family)